MFNVTAKNERSTILVINAEVYLALKHQHVVLWLELLADYVGTACLQRVTAAQLTRQATKLSDRHSGGLCGFLSMDKQACKSIICHTDNITDGVSPLALSFHLCRRSFMIFIFFLAWCNAGSFVSHALGFSPWIFHLFPRLQALLTIMRKGHF